VLILPKSCELNFAPSRSLIDNAEGIACWFIDTGYNGESFFVRHAYFLVHDPYSALKTTLKLAPISATDFGENIASRIGRRSDTTASAEVLRFVVTAFMI
jgi:hypothetical protein